MYNNGDANLLQHISNQILQKQQQQKPICRSLKAEDIRGAISVEIYIAFLVTT